MADGLTLEGRQQRRYSAAEGIIMQTGVSIETVQTSDCEQEQGKTLPNLSHAMSTLRLGAAFLSQKRGLYNIGVGLTLEFENGFLLTPDIAVLPARPVNWGLEPERCKEVPLLVAKIRAPMQGSLELMQQRDFYFAEGVGSVWVVEPASQSINIFRPNESRPQIVQQGEANDPATGLTVLLEELFA